jgi:hypothetical protein
MFIANRFSTAVHRDPPQPKWIRFAGLLALLALPFITQGQVMAQQHEWVTETVESPKSFAYLTNRSLRVAQDGNPHIAYGGDHLYYAWFEGSSWNYEIADSSAHVGRLASLAIDSSNRPHVVYHDGLHGWAKYTTKSESGWISEFVDSTGSASLTYSLALDDYDHPHISLCNDYTYELRYAHRTDSGWSVEIVDDEGYAGEFSSVAVDELGHPHISYQSSGLRYAHWNGSEWQIETIDTGSLTGLFTSLELDASQRPHISYRGGDSLKYAWRDGAVWHIYTVSADAADWTSLVLDSQGQAHITCTSSYPEYQLHYAWRDPSGWHTEALQRHGLYTSLDIDSATCIHLSCYDHNRRALLYGYRDTSGWDFQQPDSSSHVGTYNSLCVDSSGFPRIAHHDLTRGYLKYASFDGIMWESDPIDATGQVGRSASMKLDSSENPHISYLDDTNEDLKYAHYDGIAWAIETVDSVGQVRLSSALSLNESGFPLIAYADWSANMLKLATLSVVGWRIESVAQGEWPWGSISIATDAEDRPHVCFASGSLLHYTYRDDLEWHTEDVAGSEGIGGYNASLALDSFVRPHLSYNLEGPCGSPGELRYAMRSDSCWHTETIAEASARPCHSSLVLDDDGLPHVSFHDGSEGALCLAHRDASGWWIETIDDDGSTGQYTSLVFDQDGSYCIAYQDGARGDLKYAYSTGMSSLEPAGQIFYSLCLNLCGPTPCTGAARMRLHLPFDGPALISVFDLLGRQIRKLNDGILPQGDTQLTWDCTDERGTKASPGTYIVSAKAGGQSVSERIVLIR